MIEVIEKAIKEYCEDNNIKDVTYKIIDIDGYINIKFIYKDKSQTYKIDKAIKEVKYFEEIITNEIYYLISTLIGGSDEYRYYKRSKEVERL